MQKRKVFFRFFNMIALLYLFAGVTFAQPKISTRNLLPKDFSDYFLLLDDDYDLACQVPVTDNYHYVKATLERNHLYDSRVDTFLRHCNTLYAAVWLNTENKTVVRAVLTGRFSPLIVSILNRKLNSKGISFYYFSRKVVLITNSDLTSFYQGAVLSVLEALYADEDVLERRVASRYYTQPLVPFNSKDITLNIDNVSMITNFLGFDYITFGLNRCSAHIYDEFGYQSRARNYKTELYLELADIKNARTALFLFSRIFEGASINFIQENIIRISDIPNEQSYISSLFPLFVIN